MPTPPTERQSSPDVATWIALGTAMVLVVASGLYRASRFDDPTRAFAAVLSPLLFVLLIWAFGYVRYLWRRKDWRKFVRFAGSAAVGVAALLVIGEIRRGEMPRSDAALAADLKAGRITPAEAMRTSRKQRVRFDDELLRDTRQSRLEIWKAEHPAAELSNFRLTSVIATETLFKSIIEYDVSLVFEGAARRYNVTILSLFDQDEGATIEAFCAHDSSECSSVTSRLADAEQKIISTALTSGLAVVLGEDGVCSEETSNDPGAAVAYRERLCEYGGGLTLAVVRRSRVDIADEMLRLARHGSVWDRHRNSMFCTVAAPPAATGWTCSSPTTRSS